MARVRTDGVNSKARAERAWLAPRPDLGVRALLPAWRALASREGLAADLIAGTAAAFPTLALALVVGVGAGLPPWRVIGSVIVGTLASALLGGSRRAIVGPGIFATGTAGLIFAVHHAGGLALACLLTAATQLIIGVLGLGRALRMVPLPMLRGFVVAKGLLVVLVALPMAIGGRPTPRAHALELIDDFGHHVTSAPVLALVLAGVALVLGAAGVFVKRVPLAAIATIGAALAAWLVHSDLPMLETASHLPFELTLPVPPARDLAVLIGSSISLAVVATLETALAARAAERLDGATVDIDQELIAIGIANLTLGFFGGAPATSMLPASRSSLAPTPGPRRARVVLAGVMLLACIAFGPLLHEVPIATVAGIAIALAVPLCDPRPIIELQRVAGIELAVAVVTILGLVFFDPVQGLEGGLAIALIAATLRLSRTRASMHEGRDGPYQLALAGPLTFLAAAELRTIRDELLARSDCARGLVVDLRSVPSIDFTGTIFLLEMIAAVKEAGGNVAVLGPSPSVEQKLRGAAKGDLLDGALAGSEKDVDTIFGKRAFSARPRMLAGLERFRQDVREHYETLFDQLADGQHPHTLFITCCDSRIDPGLKMDAHPGELFVVRCIGALVPDAGAAHMSAEAAAIEYAVGVLGVRTAIVCGHSKCGAISALKKGKLPPELASLGVWATQAATLAGPLDEFADADAAAKGVTVRQADRLRAMPLLADRVAKGELAISAWFYDLDAVELYEWDERGKRYVVVGESKGHTLAPPPPPRASRPAEATADVTTPDGVTEPS